MKEEKVIAKIWQRLYELKEIQKIEENMQKIKRTQQKHAQSKSNEMAREGTLKIELENPYCFQRCEGRREDKRG